MMEDRSARTWIWASLILQFFGYVFDAVWHGLLSPGVEPTTVGEMVRHLGTVHLPLYIGAASVLVSTSRALLRQARRSAIGIAYAFAHFWRQPMPDQAFPRSPALLDAAQAAELVASYPGVSKLAEAKDIGRIDVHLGRYLALSPICFVATADKTGQQDVTPRGDPPGAFKVLDEKTL